jgi:hypothetical protein
MEHQIIYSAPNNLLGAKINYPPPKQIIHHQHKLSTTKLDYLSPNYAVCHHLIYFTTKNDVTAPNKIF